jgi:hypothetical protein
VNPSDDDPLDDPGAAFAAFGDLDDDGADTAGGAPREPLAEPAVAWLAGQRFVHGLLRAMHQADAEAHETRVQAILRRLPSRFDRRRWWFVAAAAAVICAAAIWLVPGRLPEAEATVLRAAELLRQDVDRRFRLTTVGIDAAGRERLRHEFDLTAHPGMRFRVEGSLSMGPLHVDARFGCDGATLWLLAGNDPAIRRSVPLQDAARLLAGLGDVLDLGYLDVQTLVERLPQSFALRTVGRERGQDGQRLLRIEAEGAPRRPDVRLRQASLWCDESTGMVTRIELEAESPRGRRRFTFEHVGDVTVAPGFYERPW